MPIRINWPAVVATVIPNIGGFVNGYFVRKNMRWFESLKKPSWTPPNWVYGPVWIGLYCTLGYSSYIVWREDGFKGACLPLGTYIFNIILNWSWTPLFFGIHQIKWALYETTALCINTATLLFAFHNVSPIASYMNIPYMCWTVLATAINYSIYQNNKQIPADEKTTGEKVKEVAFS